MQKDADIQLVLQLPGQTNDDYDRLIALETDVESRLDDSSWLDGHDFGSGTMNLFIYTSDPIRTFESLRPMLHQYNLLEQIKAAFRLRNADTFQWIHPRDAEGEFVVL